MTNVSSMLRLPLSISANQPATLLCPSTWRPTRCACSEWLLGPA